VFVVVITWRVRITPRAAGAGDAARTMFAWSRVSHTARSTSVCREGPPAGDLRGTGEAHPDGLTPQLPALTWPSKLRLALEVRRALMASEHRSVDYFIKRHVARLAVQAMARFLQRPRMVPRERLTPARRRAPRTGHSTGEPRTTRGRL
jgi:hypothetical protein